LKELISFVIGFVIFLLDILVMYYAFKKLFLSTASIGTKRGLGGLIALKYAALVAVLYFAVSYFKLDVLFFILGLTLALLGMIIKLTRKASTE